MKIEKALTQRLLFVFMVLFILLQASVALSSFFNLNDPYALMYDSNQKLAERIESMPYFEMGEQTNSEGNTSLPEAVSDKSSNDKHVTDKMNSEEVAADKNKKDEMKNNVLVLAKEGHIEEISQLNEVSQEIKDQIQQADQDVKEDRFIIKYRTKENGDISKLITKNMKNAGVSKSKRLGEIENLVLDKKVNPMELAATLKSADADKDIEYIQPDFKVYYASTEDNGSLSLEMDMQSGTAGTDTQESQTNSGSGQAGETELGNPDLKEVIPTEVTVAVLDTGIDYTHPGLTDYIWNNATEIADDGIDNDCNGFVDDINGWNFYGDDNRIYDRDNPLQSAHGTHVSGIIVNDAKDYNVKIMPLKVFGENGAYTSDIINAINYAEANGAKIVNCSWGSTDNNLALKEAMENSDMLFVCAVGNARSDLEETLIYPACFELDNIISVTSTNKDGGLSYYSNYSNQLVDVAALGRDVRSTLPEGEYGQQSGTSMSAAQASGVAAAVLSVQNDLDAYSLKHRLINTADMLSNLQDRVIDGRRINLDNAVLDEEQTEITENHPADDFDVSGYNPTQEELYQLYASSGKVTQIKAKSTHTLVLKEDGSVWAWGDNYSGQCGNGINSYSEKLTQVIGLTDVVQIAVGGEHSLAVKSDGTVWAWGDNDCGQLGDGTNTDRTTPVQVSGLTDIIQIDAGWCHSLALKQGGTVWAWGYNYYGQLGDGTNTDRTTPVQVSGLTDIIQIDAGWCHSLALKQGGTVWTWGYNYYGQLGDGTTVNRTTPIQVSSLTGVIQMVGGDDHSLVVKSDGTVWAWGGNYCGQLGDGTTTDRVTPVQVSGATNIEQIGAGWAHSVVLKNDGTVWACGDNDSGEIGDGTWQRRTTLVQVSNVTDVLKIAVGETYNLALKTDGTVWAWGENSYGQLGDGSIINLNIGTQVGSLSNVVKVAAGDIDNLILNGNGNVLGWGYNYNGQLGDGTSVSTSTPVQASGITGMVELAANYFHSLAVKSDGTIWAWGDNYYGQLGDGTTTNRISPVQVSSLTGVMQVAAGDEFSLAVKSDGTVWTWGHNNYGQLGDGTTTNRISPVQVSNLTGVIQVAAGDGFSLAVKSDGTVWAWGKNNYGQLGDGTTTNRTIPVQVSGLTDVIQIAAGDNHSLAVMSDRTVCAWGGNSYGQLGDGTTTNRTIPVQVSGLTDVLQVAGGCYYSLSVKLDGTVWAWGYNAYGQLGDGTILKKDTPVQASALSNIEQISAGDYHSLALKDDGTVWVWGCNNYYQLGFPNNAYYNYPIQSQINLSNSINFLSGSYSAYIPDTGQNTLTIAAQVKDMYGNIDENALISYSLIEPYTGVSIDSNTGIVTVTSVAQEGQVQINAVSGDQNCSTTLNIYTGITFSATANNIYNIKLIINDVVSFSGRTFTLTYDNAALQVEDLCTFTYDKELTTGAIVQSGINITSFTPGEIVFEVDKSIPANKVWSGVLNIFKFKALSTQEVSIHVQ